MVLTLPIQLWIFQKCIVVQCSQWKEMSFVLLYGTVHFLRLYPQFQKDKIHLMEQEVSFIESIINGHWIPFFSHTLYLTFLCGPFILEKQVSGEPWPQADPYRLKRMARGSKKGRLFIVSLLLYQIQLKQN